VLEAQRLFEQLLGSMPASSWQISYNLGNVLSALGKHQDAITQYQEALKLETREPTIWKNLASAYHLVGNHQAEMECFDKALELDPLQPEALVSKGVSLLIDFGKPEEAASLLECVPMSKSVHTRLAHSRGHLGMFRCGHPLDRRSHGRLIGEL
jgi:tetratricopeptide (TPR) repeat protein